MGLRVTGDLMWFWLATRNVVNPSKYTIIKIQTNFKLLLIFYSQKTNWTFCFILQYNLDFRGLSARGSGGSMRDDEGSGSGAGGEGGKLGGSGGSEGSMWQFGMARRGKGDARRTRVSFLLFWASLPNIRISVYQYLFGSFQLPKQLFKLYALCNLLFSLEIFI